MNYWENQQKFRAPITTDGMVYVFGVTMDEIQAKCEQWNINEELIEQIRG